MNDSNEMKCRLLLSIDLTGSTAFKAAKESAMEPWSPVFESFFEDFLPCLTKAGREFLKDSKTLISEKDQPAFQLWKFVGDEILLEVEISKIENIVWALRSLLKALEEYEGKLMVQADRHLALKATAWLANFPVPNTEVTVPQRDSNGQEFRVRDYLGPGVDLGFRLAKSADSRRIPISASLAQVLSTLNEPRLTGGELHLGYSGKEVMKGVIRNMPYPIFWLDRSKESQTKEDALVEVNRRVDTGKALAFLDEFFEHLDTTEPVCILGEGDGCRFSKPTSRLQQLYENYVSDDPDPQYEKAVENAQKADAESDKSELESPKIVFSKEWEESMKAAIKKINVSDLLDELGS